jgi:hypothetical protein
VLIVDLRQRACHTRSQPDLGRAGEVVVTAGEVVVTVGDARGRSGRGVWLLVASADVVSFRARAVDGHA